MKLMVDLSHPFFLVFTFTRPGRVELLSRHGFSTIPQGGCSLTYSPS